ncbi:hypothetical protein RMS29_001620 [Agrobacterium rosae]|uniref:Uncharacterized protein n=1 Tax=Agrobacterium rosae TaxID=1972867 RepID=A0AAE5S1E7_9HYPH|nr:hypothetical protein [Agrobacterium rosae]KAA3510859.1 hypothetical protein DXM21_15010 [Agrobacterium rosae]KAA3517896.1 hypothetical protein DXM25_15060 [Agrobacterium rosae]MCM2434108.1 hypothetical protein [Agrobacterium rosae]MDX8329619.1 hypothetical protein [Agrobacterium rosae]MQB49443.1 hypothetical protein [Agrobacterium rosae]
MELGILRSRLPSVKLVDSTDSLTRYRLDLGILSKDSGERKDVFLGSLLKAMAYMPNNRSLVESMYKDAYLVLFEDIPYYVYEGLDGEDLFFYVSGVPLAQDQSYGNIDVFYNYLDGFCDLNM